jgi:hypothetical protein
VRTKVNLKNNAILFFAVAVVLFACANSTKDVPPTVTVDSTAKKKEIVKEEPLPPVDTFYNTITQLVGGVDSMIANMPAKWDKNFIRDFSQKSGEKYAKIKQDRLQRIDDWNKAVMKKNGQSDSSFAFYPFSGGDFIHLNWLYPNAKEYFMIAREPVGDFPDLINADSTVVNRYLRNVDLVLRDIYFRSYFITKNMIIDINNKNLVTGMFPLIMWATGRTGHEILEVKFGTVNDSGRIEFKSREKMKKVKPDAVEITFRKINSRTIKKLTYLSCDLSDQGFADQAKFYTYLQKRIPENCISFVKSASYLLHYSSFAKIRNLIKDKSNFLVQDDTGIPFKEFKSDLWDAELYGVYTRPVDDFKSSALFQRDLDSAYKDEKFYKGELSFSLGYHWSTKKQNQMVFIKKNKK